MGWLPGVALSALTVYVLIAACVWLFQEKLLFYPQRPFGKPVPPAGWTAEAVRIPMRDGTALAGVLVKPTLEKPPLVIYFGGNAEEVTAYAPGVDRSYGKRAALLVNYRGYGESTGTPGERELVSDGIEIFDWAARRDDLDTTRVTIHGASLGTGVAVQVAAARPPRCMILTSPYDSLLAVAQRIYRWLPVALLMRHPFDSLAHAPALKVPVLMLMGDADTLIPMHHSQKLADAWGGKAERVVLTGFGHNDLGISPRYDDAIRDFLSRCA